VPPNRAQSAVPRTRSRTPRRPAPPGRTSRRWAWGESTSGRIARAPLCEGTRPRFRELVLGATPPGVPLRSTARSGSRRSSASRWQCPTAWPFPPSRCAPPAGAESERRRRGDAVRSVVRRTVWRRTGAAACACGIVRTPIACPAPRGV